MRTIPVWALLLLTGFYIYSVIATFNFDSEYLGLYRESSVEIAEEEIRNEQSTPRDFILPRTPAVALEQERQRGQKNLSRVEIECVGLLLDISDGAAYFSSMSDVKAIEALRGFQESRGLSVSGELDVATRKALGC